MTAPSPQVSAEERAYTVSRQSDLRPGFSQDWRVQFFGEGHWCRADGLTHKFPTEFQAHAAGRRWVKEGVTR